MQKKLPLRIAASLILSMVLLVLPVGAFLMNEDNATQAYAEENTSTTTEISSDSSSADSSTESATTSTSESTTASSTDSSTDESSTSVSGNDAGDETEDETEGETEEVCICTDKCTQYDYNTSCPVCSKDYTKCTYKSPSVKITINTPSGWYKDSARVTFKVEDIANTGNFAIKSVKAKIGSNGSYTDVTEDMYIDISENCTVYVLVTDSNDKSYERSRNISCFDTKKPTLNAAVSDGLLTVQAVDTDSGVKVIYVNGYEFTDITNGTLNVRLSQFDAGYEYFTITAMDEVGNVSEVYKTKNPYYKDPNSEDDEDPAAQLPASATATNPSSATAKVTEHTTTSSNEAASTNSTTGTSLSDQKKAAFAEADAEESALEEKGEDQNLGKEFYTIEAASGKVFYLIIDRDGEEELVYFLTEITENDLLNVTTDNSETLPKNSAALESQLPVTESALPNNNNEYQTDTEEVETPLTCDCTLSFSSLIFKIMF